MGRGLLRKEIAAELDLSEYRVDDHIAELERGSRSRGASRHPGPAQGGIFRALLAIDLRPPCDD
jgi:FixJ family two-component response regulator